jgi:long-chain acyl-CoA synthetase
MKNLIGIIEHYSKSNPTKIAIITKNQTLTFQELNKQSSLFANSLKNFSKNSIISLMFENSTNFVISYIGTLKAGLIAHILSSTTSEKNILFQINSANSKLLVTENNEFDNLKNIKLPIKIIKFDEQISKSETITRDISINDYAHLLYTSGTTSEPKGVPITHSNLICTLKNIVSVLGYSSSDVSLSPLPLHHSFGLGCLNASLFSGGQIILLNNASDLSDVLQTIKKFKVTIFSAVPATLIKLLKFYKNDIKIEFKDLRLIMTNSTSIPSETVLEYKKILKDGHLATYYGLTEASRSTFMIFKNKLDKDSSVGKPAPHIEIKIENKNHNIGEIWIKGPNVINHYWNNIGNQNFDNGWIKTGDLGYFDKDGFLYLSGRLDDVINVGGEKVFPEYVESIIKKMNEIEEVVIVGQKHEVFGQTVKAFVKLNPHSTLKKSDILSFCIKNLEKFMVPTKIEIKNEIPKTDYGKIKRFILQSEESQND